MAVESSVRLRVDGSSAARELARVNRAADVLQGTVTKLVGSFAAVDLARRFFQGFAEADKAAAAVRTLGVDAEQLQRQLLGVSNRLKGLVSQTELTTAAYDVASAGFTDAADATNVLEAASRGAIGGLSDLGTVADATTSVLNAYGLSSDKAAKLVDGFIQTQNDGKIIVGQYAAQIGRVAPIAAAAGVGIEELNAAISAVTAQGVPVESTFAGLRQAIAGVIKPTEEAKKAAELLGIDFSSAAIKAKGFGGFLQDVIDKTGGSEVALTKLFGSVEAVATIVPLANDGLVKFNQSLDNQKNSAGAAERATEDLGGTVSAQVGSIIKNIGNVARALDTFLGPAIQRIITQTNNLISAFSTAIQKFNDLITGRLEQASGRFQFFSKVLMQSEAGLADIKNAVEALNPSVAGSTAELDRMQGALNRATNATRLVGSNAADGMRDLAEQTQGAILQMQELIDKRREALKEQPGGITPADDPELIALRERVANLIALLNQKKTGGAAPGDDRANQLAALQKALALARQERDVAKETDEIEARRLQNTFDLANLKYQFPALTKEELEPLRKILQETFNLQEAARGREDKENDIKNVLTEQEKLYQRIGQTVKSGLVDALLQAQSASEALSGVLRGVARQMMNFALGGIGGSEKGSGSGILGAVADMFRANGGPVKGGRSYIVGERGPEIFTPGVSGGITPNHAMGGANVTVNVDASGSSVQGDGPSAQQLGKAIGAAVQAELIKQKRPGGLLTS